MGERMTEEKLAQLEAVFRAVERDEEHRQATLAALRSNPNVRVQETASRSAQVSTAEREYLGAKAQLERERREDADLVSRQMLDANQTMAEASREAARASAVAARWAKWAAIWTAIAAVASLVAVVAQAWAARK